MINKIFCCSLLSCERPHQLNRCPQLVQRRNWKHIDVIQIQNALVSIVGLAGPGGHDQQDSILAPGNRLDSRVDGVDLVVAGGLAAAVVVVALKDDLLRRPKSTANGCFLKGEGVGGYGWT